MSFVPKAVKSVGKAVVSVVEAVGDAVKKVGEVVVDTVKYVAENPAIVVAAIAAPYAVAAVGKAIGAAAGATAATTAKGIALATQPVTAAAITAVQGGSLEDIGKAALGSFIAQPLGNVAGAQAAKVIGTGSAAQNALSSAVGGAAGSAAGAAVTGQDVGASALTGGLGSAGASLGRTAATSAGAAPAGTAAELSADIGEAVGRSTVGGNLGAELIGAGVGALAREGGGLIDAFGRPTTSVAETNPAPPPFGAQVGEKLAGIGAADITAPASIASRPEFATRTGETGDIVIKYTEPDGYVTFRRDVTKTDAAGKKTGYTIVYDPQDDSFTYEYTTGDATKAPTAGISVVASKTRPGNEVDVRAGQKVSDFTKADEQKPSAPREPAPAQTGTERPSVAMPPSAEAPGGAARPPAEEADDREPMGGQPSPLDMDTEGAGATARPVEDMTGAELIGDVMPEERGGRVVGEGEGGEAGEGEGGEGEGGEGEEEGALEEQPLDLGQLTDQELLNLLDVRTASVRRPRGVQSSISPRVVGTSPTAAIIGQKEPIFGGESNPQQEVWNERSLRLRKALGL